MPAGDKVCSSPGFTLLEIMIALAILGLTVTVILHTVNYHADLLFSNAATTQMFQAAKEKMNELEEGGASSKGDLTGGLTYQNTVSASDESDIVELTATIRGYGKEATITELIMKQSRVMDQGGR